MSTRWTIGFEEWLASVNVPTWAPHDMTIYELDEDLPREDLVIANRMGVSPEVFAKCLVTPIFHPEEWSRLYD